jgi:hypothetical protein
VGLVDRVRPVRRRTLKDQALDPFDTCGKTGEREASLPTAKESGTFTADAPRLGDLLMKIIRVLIR